MENQQAVPNPETDDRAFFEGLLPKGDPYWRLVAAILLRAALDAHRGDRRAWQFLQGETASHIADFLDIQKWPPTLDMLGSRNELARRAREDKDAVTLVGVKMAAVES